MPATAPFNPPAADSPGKPFVPAWNAPPVTKEKHNFAELKSIELSLLDSDDPKVVDDLVQKVKIAIRDDGFLFLEDYGVSLDQVMHSNLEPTTFGLLTEFYRCSFIANLLSPSICTTISVKRTKNAFFSIPTLDAGLDTSIRMGSRYIDHVDDPRQLSNCC